MKYNYHTHTFRCHHATGGEREYIENSIAGGITRMGFSDHIPFRFPDGYESFYRMPTEDAEEYFATVGALREEYKDRISIHIGFEMEYYPDFFDKMYSNAVSWGAEYLILGQHFTYNEHPEGSYCGIMNSSVDYLKNYVECAVAGMKSGVFTYIAHPDLFNFVGDPYFYDREMRKICEASVETGVPLEINLLGIRTGRVYPNDAFWKIAGECGCSAVLGCDAHTAKDACDNVSAAKAEKFAAKYGVKLLDEVKLVLLK